MNVRRADVVLLDFPFASGRTSKLRPALVVQNDRDNARLLNTIVAQITTRLHSLAPTRFLIDLATAEGQQTGLDRTSMVSCENLVTVEQNLIVRKLGALSSDAMRQIDACLRAALGLT